MAFYSYLSTKIIIAFITKSYQDLFGVRSYINAKKIAQQEFNMKNIKSLCISEVIFKGFTISMDVGTII